MKLQLGNFLKVFITTNVDDSGSVLLSGFTAENTSELPIITGSLSASQEKTFEYTDSTQFLNSDTSLEKFVNSNLTLGNLSFSTYLNSSADAPFDVDLWNALTFQNDYPNTDWTITPDFATLPLNRTAIVPKKLGIFVVTEGLTYVFDGVALTGAGIQFDISNLAQTTWTLNFLSSRILDGTQVTRSLSGYDLSGTLTGTSTRVDVGNYILSSARTMLVSVYSTDGYKLGSLAVRGLDLNIVSQANYISDLALDRTSLGYKFSGFGKFAVEGSLSFYVRGSGSYADTLVRELLADLQVAGLDRKYTLLVELPVVGNVRLCDLKLDNCALSVGTEYSDVLVNTLNFKSIYRTPEIVSTTVTNLLSYSEQFDNAAVYSSVYSSITPNAIAAPDGTVTADKLVESATTSVHYVVRTTTLAAGLIYSTSVYAKASGRSFIIIQPTSDSRFAYYNLSNGTVGTVSGSPVSTAIQSVGNGWYRCSISFTSPGTGAVECRLYSAATDGNATYAGNGTSGIFLWGNQLNTGTLAQYVSTATGPRTQTLETNINVNDSFIKFYT